MVLTSQGVYVESLVEAPAVHHSAAPVGKLTTWAIKVTEGACSKYLELSLGSRWAEDRSLHKPVAPAEIVTLGDAWLLAAVRQRSKERFSSYLVSAHTMLSEPRELTSGTAAFRQVDSS